MKFFHLGDLHFGKKLHNVDLIEKDQPFWVEQFLKAVDNYGVDAVVIAGDVYDERNPAPEDMKLFDHLLTELVKREKYVFVIPGNHDSAIRLSHVNELLAAHRVYIAGELERELMHITVPGKADASQTDAMGESGPATTDVTFWLMPYIFPKLVSDVKVLNREDISTYDKAARELLAVQELDPAACNVLIAHQNVLANGVKPQHSESETIIGGVGEIECSAFDAYDYVALGHIHNAQKVGRETVRYAGCPMFYDFSEIHREKKLTLVTIESKDDIRIESVKIPLLHTLVQESGTLEELLEKGQALEKKDGVYVQCILGGKQVPPRAIEQLKAVYGDCLINVKRELSEFYGTSDSNEVVGTGKKLSLIEEFDLFYQEQQDELPDSMQEELIQKILEQQSRRAGDFYADTKSVSEKESQELIDLLLAAGMEE